MVGGEGWRGVGFGHHGFVRSWFSGTERGISFTGDCGGYSGARRACGGWRCSGVYGWVRETQVAACFLTVLVPMTACVLGVMLQLLLPFTSCVAGVFLCVPGAMGGALG